MGVARRPHASWIKLSGRSRSVEVYFGRHQINLTVIGGRSGLRLTDGVSGLAVEVPLSALFGQLSHEKLLDLFEPLLSAALVREAEDHRQLAKQQRVRIKERDRYTCSYCHRKGDAVRGPDRKFWQVDHVIARAAGGSDDDANLVLACATCNQRKSDRELDEYLAEVDGLTPASGPPVPSRHGHAADREGSEGDPPRSHPQQH